MRLPLRRRKTPNDTTSAMSLADHLTELRSRLIKALVAVALGMVVGFLLYDRVLDFLVEPYCEVKRNIDRDASCRLVVTDPLESFSIRLKLSAYIGFLLASPVVLWQLWRFITPGLYAKEKRYAVPFVAASVLLFLAGAGLALWSFPRTLEFFAAFGGSELELLYTPGKYIGLLVMMMLIFGLAFEFPVVLTSLQLARVLHWRTLVSVRRYAIVGIFVVDAIITPSGDPITLLAMATPMVLFYEVSILVGRYLIRPE